MPAQILRHKDTDGSPLLEKIRDAAGQKGTGKWTAIESLEQGMPVTLIGEAVFAPDPDGSAEDDGWLLTLVWNDRTDETDLCILDARDLAAGPVGRVHAPHRVSFGFHVNWFADE